MTTLNLRDNRIQNVNIPSLIGTSIQNLYLDGNSESIQRIDFNGIERTELVVLELWGFKDFNHVRKDVDYPQFVVEQAAYDMRNLRLRAKISGFNAERFEQSKLDKTSVYVIEELMKLPKLAVPASRCRCSKCIVQ